MKRSLPVQGRSDEFFTKERCYILELSNTPEDPDVSIARARVEPGVTTRWHRLQGVTERYCIVSGTGRVEVGGFSPRDVQEGDVIHIPPMCRQRIRNTGKDDLIFLAVCTPRFTPEVYIDIDDDISDSQTDENIKRQR